MVQPVTEWRTSPPAPALAPYIESYIGYRLRGFPPGVHRGLPSRHLTFIVSIGEGIDVVAHTDPTQAPGRYGAVLSGLQASHALIAHDGDLEGVAIELSPLGARTLLGLPARALWNTTVELADVVGPVGTELWERLQGALDWSARFAACDEVLTRLVGEVVAAPALRRCWELLVGSGGNVAVDDLAREVGWSRRHLTRRFGDEFGLTPKVAGRVVRFERARRMIEAAPPTVTLARIAAACGYYDQAHLARDVAHLAGCTPGQLSEDLPSVQDGGDALVAP